MAGSGRVTSDHVAALVRLLGELLPVRRATPVFADVDRATWNLDPDAVEAAITEGRKRRRGRHVRLPL
jgi:hypothetical protein